MTSLRPRRRMLMASAAALLTVSFGASVAHAGPAARSTRPVVSVVEPSAGPINGGTTVDVRGSGFTSRSTVYFGRTPAASVHVTSSHLIVAMSPGQAAGAVHVQVETSGGRSAPSTADHFGYGPRPVVASMSRTHVPAGVSTGITVRGTGFTGATGVMIGGRRIVPARSTANALVVAVAGVAPGTYDLLVVTRFATSAPVSSDRITVDPPPPALPPVSDVGATSTDSSVRLSWTLPDAAAPISVSVRRTSPSDPLGTQIADVPGPQRAVVDSSVVDGVRYTYRLSVHGQAYSPSTAVSVSVTPGHGWQTPTPVLSPGGVAGSAGLSLRLVLLGVRRPELPHLRRQSLVGSRAGHRPAGLR